MSNILEIIPVVEAQTTDSVAQPTFGTITNNGGSTVSATVQLNTDKTAVNVGDTFKIRVRITTNDITINEYKISVSFDPNALKVIDSDPNTPGTQIKFLDNVFQVTDPATNNIVTSDGKITLDAKISGADSATVNAKDVAEISFQAQTLGATSITVIQGAGGTQLIRPQGYGITFNTNELAVQVSNASSLSNSSSISSSDSSIFQSSQSYVSSLSSIPAKQIPKTGLNDDLQLLTNVLAGVTLLIVGISLFSKKRTGKKQ